jgi:hypothetical protein
MMLAGLGAVFLVVGIGMFALGAMGLTGYPQADILGLGLTGAIFAIRRTGLRGRAHPGDGGSRRGGPGQPAPAARP